MGSPRKRTKIDHNSSLDTNNNNTDFIPMDIVNEILQRLPAKSIAKFVRVSKKSWGNIIRSNYFINSFNLRRQSSMEFQTQPHRLFFAFNEIKNWKDDHWSFFSSSYSVDNQGTDNEKLISSVEFISRMVSQVDGRSSTPIYVNGLLNFMFGRTCVISNPSTGKSIVLPVFKSRRKILTRFFGFDPINSEYKVLCIIESTYGSGRRISSYRNQVLTVGSKSLWREVDFWIPHRPCSKGICIDGIIYYLAYEAKYYLAFQAMQLILVRFDVRSEKFLNQLPCRFVEPLGSFLNLIKYESKFAIIHKTNFNSIDLWVLKDVDKVEWSKITYYIKPWRCVFCRSDAEILGITTSGEFIYAYYGNYNSFYVIYHDYKKKRHRRIQIRAEESSNSTSFVTVNSFTDYVESVMLL